VKALANNSSLPAPAREIAILVTGAHFHSAYELYAHVIAAENCQLSDDKLAMIMPGSGVQPDGSRGGHNDMAQPW
jgi:4-carboxymuconolactone decarboxylase